MALPLLLDPLHRVRARPQDVGRVEGHGRHPSGDAVGVGRAAVGVGGGVEVTSRLYGAGALKPASPAVVAVGQEVEGVLRCVAADADDVTRLRRIIRPPRLWLRRRSARLRSTQPDRTSILFLVSQVSFPCLVVTPDDGPARQANWVR